MCVAVLAVAIGLAACGSSSSTQLDRGQREHASSRPASTSPSASAPTGSTSPTRRRTAASPVAAAGLFRALQNYSQAQISAARQACQQYFAQAFPRANLSPGPAGAVPAASS